MRILYLHQYFATPAMPGGTRSYEMARRLVAAGHEVHMITTDRTPKRRGRGWYTTREAGIDVHWLPVPYGNEMPFGKRIRAFFRFAVAAAHRAVRVGGDVVFATSTPLTIAIPGVYASRRLRVPMVFEVRDLWPELPIAVGALRSPVTIAAARRLERFAYRNAAHIVALSPGMRDGIVRAGVPPGRVSVIPNSCDIELFGVDPAVGAGIRSRFAWLGDRPLVVYIGTLGVINGVGYLVRVAERVRQLDPEVRFVVIGSGMEAGRIRAEAEARGLLGTSLFLFDGIPKRDVPAWLSAADVATSLFVDLEPMWANSANKFFDALAAGRPVAINYGGWQAELLRETGAGLVLPAADHDLAAKELLDFLRDTERRREARRAAAGLARERFDRNRLAAQLRETLESVVAAKDARATTAAIGS
ncbi:MAG TPA: glycosyltransferase family 4 protein [Longimicrobiales bacterium]